MFNLAAYQEEAVEKLVNAFRELLRTSHEQTQVVFKAPTGAGKTIMGAELLKRLSDEDLPAKYIYVWAAPNALHQQSKEKLCEYLRDSNYNFIGLENLTGEALQENTLLFTNWESVYTQKNGEWSNRAVKQGENEQNVIDVLNATRAEGLEVILIVDEAHNKYLGPRSQAVVQEIVRPKLVLEVSATPSLKPTARDVENNIARTVTVPFEEVVESGLIKQETVINAEIGDFVRDDLTKIDAVIEAALHRREALKKEYEAIGSDVDPLVLIQLPDEKSLATSALDNSVRGEIEDLLDKKDIKYGNGRLAIWLSEDKRNKERIDEYNSPVEVLIFKKAIALGWDCPRAQILVMLTDIKSESFKIQTVGRILRMPEAKHYDVSALNTAYVYTNLGSIEISNDDTDAKNFIKIRNAKIKPFLKNVELPSIFISRTDYHTLESGFKKILLHHLDEVFDIHPEDDQKTVYDKIDSKMEVYPEELQNKLLADVTIQNLDAIDQENVQTLDSAEDYAYIEHLFRYLLKSWITPYGFVRSESIMKTTIYGWFERAGYGRDKIDEIQRILVCSKDNQRIFKQIIDIAKEEFEDTRYADIDEKRAFKSTIFSVPEVEAIGENFEMTPAEKYAQEPYYAKTDASGKRWNTEKNFEKFIDNHESVDWWYKNGEKMEQYFSLKYVDIDERTGIKKPAGFYPDYIIRFKDGRVGIYDTKSGSTAENKHTKAKADILQDYISTHSDLNLVGGIVDVRGEAFWLQDDPEYDADDNAKWKPFIL